jgi:hypothetical protein
MNLTIDTSISIEKRASFDMRLTKESTEWAPEIISNAYKSMPFLKSFEMDAEIDRVDSSRGFGVGRLMVYPMGIEKDAAIKQGSLVVFPVIVREKKLSPFDVFSHEGQFQPMTKEAVERILFQPNVFGRPAGKNDLLGGGNMANQFSPPTDSSGRYSNGGLQKGASVIERVAPTIREEDRTALFQKIGSHAGLRAVFESTPVLAATLVQIGQGQEKTASEIRTARRASIAPDVIQITEDGVGYLVKHANSKCLLPQVERKSAIEVQNLLGMEKMASLRESGSVVLTINPTAESRMEKTASPAEAVGVYEAQVGGSSVAGVVIPRTVSLDGEVLDAGVFAGKNVHALQKVAGVHVRDVSLPPCVPSGRGVFVYQSGTHGLATEPLEILNRMSVEKTASYRAKRLNTGAVVEIFPTHGLQKIAHLGGNQYAIPASLIFLPLRGKQVELREQFIKTASDLDSVQVTSDGLSYGLRGKNARSFVGVLNEEEVSFALGALGIQGGQIPSILKEAAFRPVTVHGTRRVVEEGMAIAAMTKAAAAVVPNVDHLRRDLVAEVAMLCTSKARGMYKEASVVISRENLDAILSLNFITPENVAVFVQSMPDLEKSANKLAEIVVASRMGMDEVRESAACRAMESLSSVINGLAEIRDKIQ